MSGSARSAARWSLAPRSASPWIDALLRLKLGPGGAPASAFTTGLKAGALADGLVALALGSVRGHDRWVCGQGALSTAPERQRRPETREETAAMYRVTVCYGQPTDPAAFDSYYAQTHVPLVRQVPGLAGFSGARCASLDRSDPAYYFVAYLAFATGGVTMFTQNLDDLHSAG